MRNFLNILSSSKYALAVIGMATLIGFGSARWADRSVTIDSIEIENLYENHFIDRQDILDLLNAKGDQLLMNNKMGSIDLNEIEERIENHQFVSKAQAYLDVNGSLSITVKQNRPIARIINPRGPDQYISTTGEILPESKHYTARVVLVMPEDRFWVDEYNFRDAKGGEEIFQLIDYISDHRFWNAQIAAIVIKKNLEIELHTQVSKQVIEFGRAEDVEAKFRKLMAFYKRILPYKGWNTYERVSLKFNDQIVCKK